MRTMKTTVFSVLAVCFLMFLIGPTATYALSSDPIIQLDTKMHNAPIYVMDVDEAGKFVVTGGGKEIRIWSLPDGKPLGPLQFPIDNGSQGYIMAASISPDGQVVAFGGHTGIEPKDFCVYFYDRASGKMIKRLAGFPGAIRDVRYSRDGKSLAVGLMTGVIHMIDTATFARSAETKASTAMVRSMDFDRQGRLVVASGNGQIILYDRSLKLIAQTKISSGTSASVRFSPDGRLVAAGIIGAPRIEILSGDDLKYLYSPDLSGLKNTENLYSVAWSRDGQKLVAGGTARQDKWVIFVFDDSGKGKRRWIKVANNTIHAIETTPGGEIVLTTGDPMVAGYNISDGKRVFSWFDVGYDYRGSMIKISPDGSAIMVSYKKNPKLDYRFSLIEGDFGVESQRDDELAGPVFSAPGLKVSGFGVVGGFKINDQDVAVVKKERVHYAAIVPGGRSVIVGTDFYLIHFDNSGKVLWKKRVLATPWAVNVSANGKVVVAGHQDGTIRWYRVSDNMDLAAMYRVLRFDGPRKPWVAWTPHGYYTACPGADSLIGWHVNNGWDKESYFYSVARFRKTYYRPEVVARMMMTYDESAALKAAGEAAQTSVVNKLPPIVRILSPADGARISGNTVAVKYTVESPTSDSIMSVKVLVDGRPIPAARDIVLENAPARAESRQSQGKDVTSRSVDVPIDGSEGTITIIAVSKNGASEPASVRVAKAGTTQRPSAEGFTIKPKLYVLAIGISKYTKHPENNLRFAAKDATDFANSMSRQKNKLYRDVQIKILTDTEATRASIVDGLQWLKRSATQHDVAMIFMSSHGDNSSGQYYFIPSDFEKSRLESTSVLFTYIKDAVASIPGKVLVFMDTCHAGDVLGGRGTKAISSGVDGIVNELISAENGAVVFTSSTGRQTSLEDAKWNNGAFTRALVDGLAGKADLTNKGKITINMLDLYLSERVKELTQGKQTPTTAKPQTIQDFPIAIVR